MELHGYQRRAVEHLRANDRAALFLDMGLGKTATVLSALQPRHLPALVIAPKRVAEHVWGTERDTWRPDLTIEIAAGSPGKRRSALDSNADVIVIGRDNISDVPPGRFDTVILDELSGFKNRSSKRWRAARKLCQQATHVWGLTGTPSPNGLTDLWSQIFLLDNGSRLHTTLTAFRSRWFDPGRRLFNGTVTEWIPKPGADAQIHEALSDICLSMSASDYLELPPVTHNRVQVSMPPRAQRAYQAMKSDLVATLDVTGTQVTAASAGVLTGKLSQITSGAIYQDAPANNVVETLHTAKIDALAEIVDGTGSPVLVFWRFKHERDAIMARLPQAREITEPGVITLWGKGEVPVLLAHPASAGHGLNLQHGGSHTIAWTSLDWSSELWQQANARLVRQGQKHPVTIHRLEVPGTVDGAIWDRLQNKRTVEEALLDALAVARS